MDSVGENKPQEVKEPSGKRRDLSNRPDGYKTIGYVFIGNELKSAQFKDTVHQVCMSHAKNKFVKASNHSGEPAAKHFSNILKEFFMKERKCNDA